MKNIKLLILGFSSEEEAGLRLMLADVMLERVAYGKSNIDFTFCHYSKKSDFGFYSKEYTHFLVDADLNYIKKDLQELGYENIQDILLLYARGESKSGNLSKDDTEPNEKNSNTRIFFSQYAGEQYRLMSFLCNL